MYFQPKKLYSRDVLDRTIHIYWNGDIVWTVRAALSGMLTCIWTVRSPNTTFQKSANLKLSVFLYKSIVGSQP